MFFSNFGSYQIDKNRKSIGNTVRKTANYTQSPTQSIDV